MSVLIEALAGIAKAAAAEATARTLRRVAWLAASGLFVLVAVAFAAAAGYEALAVHYGTLFAKLIIAGAFLIAGLAILVVLRIQDGRRRREAARSGTTTTAAVAFAMGLMSGLGRKSR